MKKITNAEFLLQVAEQIRDGSLQPETDYMGRISFHTDWFETVGSSTVQSEPDPAFKDHIPESR